MDCFLINDVLLKLTMKVQIIFLLFLLIGSTTFSQVNKKRVYECLNSSSKAEITEEIKKLQAKSETSENLAFLGTLKMKAAQFHEKPKDRLEDFKIGKALLEKEISANPKLVEYRFLRLMIQENAPAILKYQSNIREDVLLIENGYSTTKGETKTAIASYSKVSKYLKKLQ